MADPEDALRALLTGRGRVPGGALMQGQRGSPDLPSPAAQSALGAAPTDQSIQDFLDRFGVARTESPGGPVPGQIPMPRPRYPDLAPGPMGMQESDVPPGVTMRPQDVIRQQLEGSDTRRYGAGAQPEEGESVAPSAGEQENAPGPSDEQMLERVQRGMGGGDASQGENIKGLDVDEDRAALEANGFDNADVDTFVQHWGPDELPDSYKPDYESDAGGPGRIR